VTQRHATIDAALLYAWWLRQLRYVATRYLYELDFQDRRLARRTYYACRPARRLAWMGIKPRGATNTL